MIFFLTLKESCRYRITSKFLEKKDEYNTQSEGSYEGYDGLIDPSSQSWETNVQTNTRG